MIGILLALHLAAAEPIRFHMDSPGYVSLNLYREDGTLVRQVLAGKRLAAGDHELGAGTIADGTDAPALPPGKYQWRAVIHDGLALRLRGWVGDWGGDLGAPDAAAADDTQVYLGWALASAAGDSVVACDPTGTLLWTHRRGALSGCHALAVDAGVVFVLGGEGGDADGAVLYKLNAKDGSPIRWPDGSIDLKISSLWPVEKTDAPSRADYFTVKNGRIYLSFTVGNFTAILDAKTGAYLQTIVGSRPGAIDSAGTKCDTPAKPGVLVGADFVVMGLVGGAIDKLLFVHDPIWVIASDLTYMPRGQSITALCMIGDAAKHHTHDIFVGLGPPFHQVQVRSALDADTVSWFAGKTGGRAAEGPWDPGAMSFIRAIALDDAGNLWVAEGDAIPKRISVWSTEGAEGHFLREYFAPPGSSAPAAINPLDPQLVVAGGCEWRIDPHTARAACLGIITRDPVRGVRFAVENGHTLLVRTANDGSETVLERAGDSDYKPYSGPPPAASPGKFRLVSKPDGSFQFTNDDGFALAAFFGKSGEKPRATIQIPQGNDWPHLADVPGTPSLAVMPDGRVFVTAGSSRVWEFELRGLDTLRPLASGTFAVQDQK